MGLRKKNKSKKNPRELYKSGFNGGHGGKCPTSEIFFAPRST
jgi:hypothetical protein